MPFGISICSLHVYKTCVRQWGHVIQIDIIYDLLRNNASMGHNVGL